MTCNRCRCEIHPEAPHRKGEHTPVVWCEPCFDVVMDPQPYDAPLAGLDKRKLAKAFPDFTEAMRALKARAAMKAAPRRVVTIGGE